MTVARAKQIVLRTAGILLLGSILFQFEQVPCDDILYGAEPSPLTIAPFRYKIPPPPPPPVPASQESSQAEMTDVQPLPEQQGVSTKEPSHPGQQGISTKDPSPADSPVLSQPASGADHSADKGTSLPLSDAGAKQKNQSNFDMAASKSGAKAASKSGTDSRLKSEPPSPKASDISGSSRKIVEIGSDLTLPSAEMITIVLTGLFPPQTQVIEGRTPKIICDFPDVLMEKTIKRTIPIHGKYVLQVRTGIHPPPEPKSRIVIDLAPDHDYQVEQLFYEQNNRYSMIIREKP